MKNDFNRRQFIQLTGYGTLGISFSLNRPGPNYCQKFEFSPNRFRLFARSGAAQAFAVFGCGYGQS
jgi:hypothetical protein